MSDVIKTDLADKFMSKALVYLESAEAFTKSEVPKFLEELLEFKLFEHLLNYFDDVLIVGGLLALFVIIFIISYKKLKLVAEKLYDGNLNQAFEETYEGCATAVSAFFSILFLMFFLMSVGKTYHLVQAYKIKTAPRVYLLDYVRGK